MFKKILVKLENSKADKHLIHYIIGLAQIHSSHVFLVYVAEGWKAANYDALDLKESDEMKINRDYLEKITQEIIDNEIPVTALLALGEPSNQILKIAEEEHCDLIAMSSSGRRFWVDLFFGSTVEAVRYQAKVPILIV